MDPAGAKLSGATDTVLAQKSLVEVGNRARPGSPGCHEESQVRMMKANLLTLSTSSRRLSKLLYPWSDPPIPLPLTGTWTLRARNSRGRRTPLRRRSRLSMAPIPRPSRSSWPAEVRALPPERAKERAVHGVASGVSSSFLLLSSLVARYKSL